MQRNFISKFCLQLRKANGCGSISPMHVLTRSFQASPIAMNIGGSRPGKIQPKMAKLQKLFQEKNDKPVFLKGGGMDSILYRLTLVLCLVGTLGDLWLFLGYLIA